MFVDSYTYANIDVEVKRAPTDESVRLLEEFKEKAYKSIIDSFQLTDNSFNCNVIYYKENFNYTHVVLMSYSLNGRKYNEKILVDADLTREKIMETIFRRVSDRIAVELLKTVRIN